MGLFEHATGGILFLDEVANASLPMQAELLRVLEDGQIRRIGENTPRTVDVRIISATNVSLDDAVTEGRFRKDLYYRLKGIHFVLPPLRERREDIPLLVDHFLQRSCTTLGKEIRGLTDEAMQQLLCYDWPGNVRELEHCIKAAVLICQNPLISPHDLQLDRQENYKVGLLYQHEKEVIVRILQECGGNKRRAAKLLGISRNTLYQKLRRYGLL